MPPPLIYPINPRFARQPEVAPAAPMEYIKMRLSFAGDGRLEVFES